MSLAQFMFELGGGPQPSGEEGTAYSEWVKLREDPGYEDYVKRNATKTKPKSKAKTTAKQEPRRDPVLDVKGLRTQREGEYDKKLFSPPGEEYEKPKTDLSLAEKDRIYSSPKSTVLHGIPDAYLAKKGVPEVNLPKVDWDWKEEAKPVAKKTEDTEVKASKRTYIPMYKQWIEAVTGLGSIGLDNLKELTKSEKTDQPRISTFDLGLGTGNVSDAISKSLAEISKRPAVPKRKETLLRPIPASASPAYLRSLTKQAIQEVGKELGMPLRATQYLDRDISELIETKVREMFWKREPGEKKAAIFFLPLDSK